MADVVIFPEQTLEFLTENGYGEWAAFPAPFVLVAGETYRVVLDGTTYVLPCEVVDGMPTVTNIEDLNSTTQPEGAFALYYLPAELSEDGTDGVVLPLVDSTNASTHTLAIYQTAVVSNDVITENWDGSTEVHPGVESVSLETEDGGEKEFILKDLVAEPVEKTVELDFSGGDMTVTPEEGQVFSSILIPKPPNLIPENIPKDLDIAGVIGAMAASSGGNVRIAAGSMTLEAGYFQRIETAHGFVPDFIFAHVDIANSKETNQLFAFWGVSEALATATGVAIGNKGIYRSSAGGAPSVVTDGSGCITNKSSAGVNIYLADETGFSLVYSPSSGTWNYIIIGGLTLSESE